MISVYVAAASAEIERAEHAMAACREAGLTVVSTWAENIRRVGASNPRDASRRDRMRWAHDDLAQVASADLLWLLVPPVGTATIGAWIEFGSVIAWKPGRVVASGDTMSTIFCALVDREYTSDGSALEAVLHKARNLPWHGKDKLGVVVDAVDAAAIARRYWP